SRAFNAYGVMQGMPLMEAMTEADMEQSAEDFALAAERAKACGFDAVELHYGHGYLLSQFLSPRRNHRRDAFGGSLENRMRFPKAVLQRVRAVLGPDFPVLAKINLDDGVEDGLHVDEATEVAAMLEANGASA